MNNTAEGKKLTIELSKTTLLFGAILLVLGYFVGNALPLGGAAVLPTGNTILNVGDSGAAAANAPLQAESGQAALSGDDPSIGSKDAKVQIYEFSDFQCPFCRKFYTESFAQLESEYIDTGKVQFIYKDFPLEQIHPAANMAAQYSECANEQGKWEQFHKAIFDGQNAGGSLTPDEIASWMQGTGIDVNALASCVTSGKYANEVQSDLQEGIANGVSGTPSFFIGSQEKGFVKIVGAQPYSIIKQAIDQALQ